MKKQPVKRGEARERLLLATRDKIIAQGVDGVSIRAINAAAGVSAGIFHYHFESLEELILELLGRFMKPLMAERENLLDLLSERKKPATVQEVTEALVMPVAKLAIDHHEGYGHVCLLARLYADRSPLLQLANKRWGSKFNSKLFKQLQLCSPNLSNDELAIRMDLAGLAMLRGLSALHQPPVVWLKQQNPAKVEAWEQVRIIVDFVAAGLGATQQAS